MREIPLKQIPNQEVSVQLDDGFFNLSIKTTGNSTSVSIAYNGTQIIQNMRAVSNQYIIPSAYQEHGNFMFVTSNFELPYYSQFGLTQSLIYVTGADMAVIRQPVTPPIVASDFNPAGNLPLRFKPQGYVLV